MIKKLVYIVIILILFSCTKNGKNISVEGIVYNPLTGKGIEGITVRLLKNSNSFSGGFKEVKSTTTNNEGHYSIDHLGLSDSYYLQVLSGHRYDLGWTPQGGIGITGINKGETFYGNYEAVGYGKYRILINNVNCQGVSDSIILNQHNQVGTIVGSDWVITGCGGFYSDVFYDVPMGNIWINWKVIRGGIETNFADTVFLNEGEELTYTLNY